MKPLNKLARPQFKKAPFAQSIGAIGVHSGKRFHAGRSDSLWMTLAATGNFNRMAQQHEDGHEALFGSAFAPRQIDDQG